MENARWLWTILSCSTPNKEVLKKGWGMLKGHKNQPSSGQLEQSEQRNKGTIYWNPWNKVNTHKLILI